MRGKRARQLREAAREVTRASGVKKGEYRPVWKRLYRVMKRDWKEGRRERFEGLL